jgi:ABC-type Fe3+-hydroxamate transport system substrate-binding protein
MPERLFPSFIAFKDSGAIDTEIGLWRMLGRLAGTENKVAALRARFQSGLAAVKSRLGAATKHKTRVLIIVSGAKAIWVEPEGNSLTPRLQLAGARNAARALTSGVFNLESIARIDPDVVLISTAFAHLEP